MVTCWERADLLALVCGVFCEFVTFPLVSWVRCGTWLYRFLIFAPLLTFTTAGDWDCVAAVERLPALHYSVDFIFLSFGIMGFIVELCNYKRVNDEA